LSWDRTSSASSIRTFWRRLDYAVHPDDAEALGLHKGTFNLDFPPPSFIGDVDNAPVVILMLNGGYDPSRTPAEFSDPADCAEYLQWLKGERTEVPRNLSRYYTQHAVFPWVQEGKVVIVNAVAYRSPQLRAKPENKWLQTQLPSAIAHRQWLQEEVLPAAARGARLVVAHRCRLWDFSKRKAAGLANVYHSLNPVSPYLSKPMIEKIRSWMLEKAI
jgi:hypothetical protein